MTSTALAAPSRRWHPRLVAASLVFVLACLVAVGGLLTSSHPGDVGHYQTFGARLKDGLYPYGSGFYLEYPPFAIPVFALPEFIASSHYLFVFKLSMLVCGLAALWLAYGVASRLYGRKGTAVAVLAVPALAPVLLGPTYLNRFDPWPAALTALALLLFARDRSTAGAFVLALAFAAKTYPAAVVPVAAIWVWRRGGARELARAVASFAAACLVVYAPFVPHIGGLGNSYYTQLKRHLQIESAGASVLLVGDKLGVNTIHWFRGMSVDLRGPAAGAIGAATSVLQLAAIVAVAVVYFRSRRADVETFMTAAAAAVVAFVAFGRVYSPQYTVWLVPLVPMLVPAIAVPAAALVGLILVLTQVNNRWGDWGLRHVDWTVWVVSARNLSTILLFVLLLESLRRAGRSLLTE
ncbi:MAG TPA: glycosyltransferase 87 family protein [Gaiellaceae bacterium]|jgi:hypothetical protein